MKDTKVGDNASARVQLRYKSNKAHITTHWSSGRDGVKTKNLKIAEGKKVQLRTCRVVKSTGYVHTCSKWRNGTA